VQFTVFIPPAGHIVTLTPWGMALLLLLVTAFMAAAVLMVRTRARRTQRDEPAR